MGTASWPHPGQHRAEGREVGRPGRRVRRLPRVELPGQREVAGRAVVEVVVRHRPDDGVAVGELGETRADARRRAGPARRSASLRKLPRTSSGASGFGSQVSSWLCPPLVKTTSTDFALPKPGPRASADSTPAPGEPATEHSGNAEPQPVAAGWRPASRSYRGVEFGHHSLIQDSRALSQAVSSAPVSYNSRMLFEQITIVGVGSHRRLGRARGEGAAARRRGWSASAAIRGRSPGQSSSARSTRSQPNSREGVKDADLVVVCTPVDRIADTILRAAPHLPPRDALHRRRQHQGEHHRGRGGEAARRRGVRPAHPLAGVREERRRACPRRPVRESRHDRYADAARTAGRSGTGGGVLAGARVAGCSR